MSPHISELFQKLDAVRTRLRLVALLSGVMDMLVALLLVVPLVFLLDNWIHFSTPSRWAGCLVILGAAGTRLGRHIRLAFRRWRYEQLALRVEERYPELENRLINAIQLSAAPAPPEPLAAAMIDSIASEAVAETRGRNLRRAVETRSLRRGFLIALALAPLVALYPILLPDQFENAALRIMLPTRAIMPLTRVRLDIQPGDAEVRAGQDLTISAAPQSTGNLPRQVRIEIDSGGAKAPVTMAFDGNHYVHQARDVSENFRYRVLAEDFESPWYKVKVFDFPRIERMDVRYEYPAYTALPPATTEGFDGNLAALQGSRATVTAWTNRPIGTAQVGLKSGGAIEAKIEKAPETAGAKKGNKKERGSVLTFSLPLKGDGIYQWKIADTRKRAAEEAPNYTIKALPDDPPRVTIVSPPEAIQVPRGKDVNILYTAWDDYGVANAELLIETAPTTTQTLSERKLEKPLRTLNEGCVLKTSAFKPGQELRLVARAADANPEGPGRGRSQALIIKIGTPESLDSATSEALGGILKGLARLLENQVATRRDVGDWSVTLSDAKVTEVQRTAIARKLTVQQSTIRADARALADSEVQDAAWKKLSAELRALADKEMHDATSRMEGFEKEDTATRKTEAAAVMKIQTAIIDALKRIIDALVAAHPELKDQAEEAKKKVEERPKPDSLSDVHDAMLDYLEEHEGIVKSLQKMEGVNPKDFQTSQSQQLEELAKIEEKWSEYFKDCKDWLREAPMVKGGTESGLKDELNEMFNEIDKLPEALRHDPITMNVKEEQTGVELAKTLKEDLEKWLPEEPDYIKWVMENSSKDYEVPMADLPDELEDMIGDLIESEQEMTEANEDQTSNWADSMSQAGWGASDGPISNYSAKGVTGNTLPNNMDIAGRSGEGRSGRSLGEMVESVASGKGGRDTQTRMTNDAMGAGQVQDLSTEQTKGATGGGKIAGTTGYGLVSPNAPVQPDVVQKMAQKQADLKMKAMNLQQALVRMCLPGAGLDRSIQGMNQVQQAIQKGRYETLKDLGATVVQDLKDQRRLMHDQLQLRHEGAPQGGRKVITKARQDNPETYPEEYRDMISAYYQALSTEEKK